MAGIPSASVLLAAERLVLFRVCPLAVHVERVLWGPPGPLKGGSWFSARELAG